MLECDMKSGKILFFFVQFLFVRYSVYIIFRVTIHVSPEKKLAMVRATRCTPLCVSCMASDQQRVSSYHTRDITKNTQTQLNYEYKSHYLVYDLIWFAMRQSTAINSWWLKVDLMYCGQNEFIYMYIGRAF